MGGTSNANLQSKPVGIGQIVGLRPRSLEWCKCRLIRFRGRKGLSTFLCKASTAYQCQQKVNENQLTISNCVPSPLGKG